MSTMNTSAQFYVLHSPPVCGPTRAAHVQMVADAVTAQAKKSSIAECNVVLVHGHEPGDDAVKNAAHGANLHPNQASAAMKHVAALGMVADGAPKTYTVVLEDDAILVAPDLFGILATVPADADVVLLGYPGQPGISRWSPDMPIEFLTGSYAVAGPAAAAKLRAAITARPFAAARVSFATAFAQGGVTAYVIHGCCFGNGSKVGAFVSHADPDNRLSLDPTFLSAENVLTRVRQGRQRIASPAEARATLFQGLRNPEHPDCLKLAAYLMHTCGFHAEAHEYYEKARVVYERDQCAADGINSPFLRAYMSLWREMPLRVD